MSNYCDDCDTTVSPYNDASLFEHIRTGDVYALYPVRHLFPITAGGKVYCGGSPNIYQYLPGYTTARAFFCEPVKMLRYRATYREMQRQARLMEAEHQEQKS